MARRRLVCESLEHRYMLTTYSIVDLGPMSVAALNDSGQVAGALAGHAVVEVNGTITDLGTLGNASSAASDINNPGQVVGYAETAGGLRHAFLVTPEDADGNGQADRWYRDTDGNGINDLMYDLGTLGGPNSEARGINNLGQVVGWADTSTVARSSRAFVWNSATGMRDLGTFGGSVSEASAINDRGQVVGTAYSYSFGPTPSAIQGFRWDSTSGGSLLENLYSSSTHEAMDVNESGQVVGVSGRLQAIGPGPGNRLHYYTDAFLWAGGSFADLGINTIARNSDYDVSVNKYGQVVGLSTLWQENNRINLNDLVDPSLGWT